MGRDEVPPDPTVLGQPGVSFTLGQASLLRYEGTKEQTDSKVRKSFPRLEVSEHLDLAAHLAGNGTNKRHHGDAHLPELLPVWLEGLHDSRTFLKPALLLLMGATAWLEDLYATLCQDPLVVRQMLHQQKKGGSRQTQLHP